MDQQAGDRGTDGGSPGQAVGPARGRRVSPFATPDIRIEFSRKSLSNSAKRPLCRLPVTQHRLLADDTVIAIGHAGAAARRRWQNHTASPKRSPIAGAVRPLPFARGVCAPTRHALAQISRLRQSDHRLARCPADQFVEIRHGGLQAVLEVEERLETSSAATPYCVPTRTWTSSKPGSPRNAPT